MTVAYSSCNAFATANMDTLEPSVETLSSAGGVWEATP
jgi:hypothetical protein